MLAMRRTTDKFLKRATHIPLNAASNPTSLSIRSLSTSSARQSEWSPQPAPPRLPKEEQEIFDRLQRESAGPFSTPKVNQSPQSSASERDTNARTQSASVAEALGQPQGEQVSATAADAVTKQQDLIEEAKELAAVRNGEELHPNVRKGAPPEFEGDVNPKTGESGGPKNEPLRWGGSGDWSYNGRVTDF